jgi:hypothetical protein
VLQTNGKVLCTGGLLYETPATSTSNADYFSENAQFFEFDPSDNSLSAFTPAPISSSSAPNTWTIRFLLLPNAQILMTTQSGEMYLYTPDASENDPDPSWRPTLTSFPQTLVQGHTYTVTGTQLNGLSQAVSYGDDAQQATNYPIFRLSSGSQVVYLHSGGHRLDARHRGDRRAQHACTRDVADGRHRQRDRVGARQRAGRGAGLLPDPRPGHFR